MFKRLVPVVAALTLVLGMSGCGQAKADKGELVDKLVEDGVSEDEASCIADALFDDKFKDDDDTLNDIASAESEDDLPPAVRDVVNEVIADCKRST